MVHYAAPDGLKRLIPTYQPNDQTDGLRGPNGRHFPSAALAARRPVTLA